MNSNAITEFRGPYRFLSNFWPAPVYYGSFQLPWPTVEHAYQAAKFETGSLVHRAIFHARTPGDAKRLGQSPGCRPDWERIRLGVMEDLLEQKFTHHADLRAQLLATHPHLLQEGNRWGDRFWGVDLRTGQGENHLGKLLMALRDQLLEE